MVDDIMGIAKCGVESAILNTVINTKIEMKNLQFHTRDKNGLSKCHWMHVGKAENIVLVLKFMEQKCKKLKKIPIWVI